jgi:hypothetical protein
LKREHANVNGNGFITPPLTPARSSARRTPIKRLVLVTLIILVLLHFSGFSLLGTGGGNDKVVIILAANIGGGIRSFIFILLMPRRTRCQEWRRMGYGKVEHPE